MGRGPLQAPGAAGGEGFVPPPVPTRSFSFLSHCGPALGLKALSEYLAEGQQYNPRGTALSSPGLCHQAQWSPQSLILAKQAWVATQGSAYFCLLDPIFTGHSPVSSLPFPSLFEPS